MAILIDDSQLLDSYSQTGDQAAFAELVSRHGNLVYSTARQRVRDSHLAEDVTQAVFIILARKSRSVRAGRLLGWLFQTTRYTAEAAIRLRARRAYHERQATRPEEQMQENPMQDEMTPLLGDALAWLSEIDRSALLMRHYRNMPASEIARALGLSTTATEKRLQRAMAQLRRYFQDRGITTSTDSLPAIIATVALRPAPLHLIASIASTATTTTSAAAGSAAAQLAKGTAQMIILSQTKAVAAIVLGVVIVGAGVAVPVLQYTRAADARTTQPVAAAALVPTTQSTDPTVRQQLGAGLAAEGKYAQALEEYLWCFDHGLEYMPAYMTARGSSLLRQLGKLADQYPPARQALSVRCDARMAALLSGPANINDASDYGYLSDMLGRQTECLKVFERLKATDPAASDVRRPLANTLLDMLIAARRYDDALEAIPDHNALAWAEMLISATNKAIGVKSPSTGARTASSGHISANTAAMLKRSVIPGIAPYYEALLGAHRTAEARQLAETLIAFYPSPDTFASLAARARHAGATEEAIDFESRASRQLTK
jgi:RNA polymerase sigma factor (sigma-70 family)